MHLLILFFLKHTRSYVIRLASAVLRLGLVFLESVEQHTSCKAQVRKTRLRRTRPALSNGEKLI